MFLLPTVFACGDEVVGAEFAGVGFFGARAGDGDDFICAEGFGPEETEVAETWGGEGGKWC